MRECRRLVAVEAEDGVEGEAAAAADDADDGVDALVVLEEEGSGDWMSIFA